jgi:hypothetical protein
MSLIVFFSTDPGIVVVGDRAQTRAAIGGRRVVGRREREQETIAATAKE